MGDSGPSPADDAPGIEPPGIEPPGIEPPGIDVAAAEQHVATEQLETELKLGADVHFVLPDLGESLPDLVLVDVPALSLEAVYFDTEDLALTRSKVSLRHRTGEGAGRWTLKLPKDRSGPVDPDAAVAGTLRRRELNVVSDDRTAVPAALDSLVTGWTRGAPLRPVVTLRTERTRIELRHRGDAHVVGEVDDDVVEVVRDGVISESFREIEIEVNDDATNDVLPTIAAALRFAGAQEADSTSKVGRALGTAGAVPPVPVAVVVDPGSTVRAFVAASLSRGTTALIAVDHAIRLDDDADAVRRASAAVRRLRSDLRSLRSLLDGPTAGHLREELGWLQDQLGRVRELDVTGARARAGLERLTPDDREAAAPMLEHLSAVRELTRSALVTSMGTPRYVALLRSLVAACAEPPVLSEVADRPASRAARRVARRPVQRIGREVAALVGQADQPTDAQLRDLRRRIRQARFVVQLVDPLVPGSSRRLVRSLVRAQDRLGVLADAVATEDWLRATERVFASPSLSFVVGQLVADERARAAAVRTGWYDVAEGITHPADQYLRR